MACLAELPPTYAGAQQADPGPAAGAADSIALLPGLSIKARREIARHLELRPAILAGDTEIPRDSVLPGALLVAGGTLRFAGRTPASVMVVGGDFFLRPGAQVGGDVVVVGGGYYGSGLGRVEGETRIVREGEVEVVRAPGRVEVTGGAETARAPFPVALGGVYGFVPEMYNRVDGLAVRWGVRYVPPRKREDGLGLSAQAILRSSRGDIGWEAAATRAFPARRLALRAAWYNVTDTGERWHRSDVEASLATLFLGEDNRFYFDRKGVELRASHEFGGPLSADLAVRNDEYRSLLEQDPFTVAADDFQPNRRVAEGTLRSLLGGLTWEGRDDPDLPTRGWWARLEGEAAGGLLAGDHSFTAGRLDVRRYQPVGPHRLDARVVIGGRIGGDLPEQRRFHLGGAATLPAYEALQIQGDRTAFANLRYRIALPALRRFGLFKEAGWLVLLADGGDAWESRDDDPEWLASGGVGVAGHGPLSDVGLYVVVPTERTGQEASDVSVFLYFGRFF